ncbi:hypothetical protein QQ008_23065 [Fulvivirgaceae bacterium BMA10]|uniref:DUF5689 domain-containing protein n=1 Tax=Splendidivirga corallicola TaxID=3051826 RepID=A0ABT8KU41_9BACT|nr:hypothetical protein [Fulvivirgaceae bacterium BMA10]
MKNIKSRIYRFLPLFLIVSLACIDETEQVTPLSMDSLVAIPSESNEGSILESEGSISVPIVLSNALSQQGTIQLQLSSSDGTTYGTDYTTTPEANSEGIVTLSLSSGSVETSFSISPVLDPAFNANKVVNVGLLSASEGLVLGNFKDYTLTIVNKPIINVSGAELAFGAVASGSLPVVSYRVTGYGLLGDIDLSTSSDFLVSLDNDTYSESLTIPSGSAEQTPVTVFVQFNASTGTLGERSGIISHATKSGDNVTVSVSGKEVQFSDFVSSGFEDVDLTGLSVEYTKSGTAELVNNIGEAPVDFVMIGTELGFDSSFDPNDIGDDGGEPMGVGGVTDLFDLNDDISFPFSYNGGKQGYHASDLDGTLEIVFDEVTFDASVKYLEFSMAVFLYSFEGNFDSGEGVELVWRNSSGDIPLIDIEDINGNGNFTVNGGVSFSMESWSTAVAGLDISQAGTTGQVVVRIFNDNNDDVYIVDDIAIRTSE